MKHIEAVAVFNAATSEFLRDLADAYSGYPVFRLIADLHDAAAAQDPEKPLNRFHQHVMIRYGDQIRAENFRFFEENEFGEAPVGEGVIENVKRLWRTTSEENRESIKAHLRVLMRAFDEARVGSA